MSKLTIQDVKSTQDFVNYACQSHWGYWVRRYNSVNGWFQSPIHKRRKEADAIATNIRRQAMQTENVRVDIDIRRANNDVTSGWVIECQAAQLVVSRKVRADRKARRQKAGYVLSSQKTENHLVELLAHLHMSMWLANQCDDDRFEGIDILASSSFNLKPFINAAYHLTGSVDKACELQADLFNNHCDSLASTKRALIEYLVQRSRDRQCAE